ncbi:DUF2975 domain-containing protein [Clostridium sardiniense]|uniref:DUF2975 domain-containing protein n=1 Tax=Clostridium sardiniense TaxID=29369 RepID=A0ABS7KTL9_CLOSR|nr:DUF2975 domain-containing protein [Clostridium sardiniense]MBY0754170.1 DUF2975 domain-containing protein [Clostridium sardiniense]MDQ0459303.1 putative membrane protein YczE [Clostridium sardiniense]
MKRETLFLKAVVFLIGIIALGLCIFLLPRIANKASEINRDLYHFIIVVYVSAIPFFIALYQALRILSYIDKNEAFSYLSVKALKNIKYCAMTISILYVLGLPLLYIIADKEDAPGIIVIGMVVVFAAFVIGIFAAVLQKLLKNVIDIKSENDLTV